MATRWIVAAGLAVLVLRPVRADDRATALGILDRAIRAHGGTDALGRARLSIRTGNGVATTGAELPFRSELIVNLPNQVRLTIEANRLQLITIINGDQGWQSAGGAFTDLTRQRIRELQEEAYVWWLATLTPLLKDGFELTPLPETKVAGKPALGVKVSARGRPDTSLYFDKDTGLLVKIARVALDAGQKVDTEYLFTAFKDFDGVKLPAKEIMNKNGRKITEVTYSSYKFLSRPDEAAFSRP
jgi:hypothetical protein